MRRRSEEERLSVADEVELMQAVLHTGERARLVGFDEVARAKLMTTMSELTRNILKYAGKGTVHTARLDEPDRRGLEIIAEDEGPGIADIARALEDHFSTSGTLGLGLPGVKRMMDEFEVQSAPNRGTRVIVRKWV